MTARWVSLAALLDDRQHRCSSTQPRPTQQAWGWVTMAALGWVTMAAP
jgi:hypothetical protein